MKLRGGGEAKGQVINFWIRSEFLCLCAIVMFLPFRFELQTYYMALQQ